MRHNKHRHQLGVTKEHRAAIMASLGSALFRHDRIETTLANAKALKPFAEKLITLAKKAAAEKDAAKKLHFRKLAIARLRDSSAVHFLFVDKVGKFVDRKGGYTRIYKLIPRMSDAADMAIIELVEAGDPSNKDASKAAGGKKPAKKSAAKKVETASNESAPAAEEESKGAEETVADDSAKKAKKPAAKKTAAKKAAPKKAAEKSADKSEDK